ncbi:MAG: DUF1294 domain-containing protein [Candidatus Magasanikbacteria bacterium]|nr:DUF1294 domain-containing protein [Candidatus Magasanikbacteria bacterium]
MTSPLLIWPAIIYLTAINLITLFLYGSDKLSARAGADRVRERTLLLLALLGGSPAALLAMKLFRHKTRKASFLAILTLILLIQLALFITVYPRITPGTPSLPPL